MTDRRPAPRRRATYLRLWRGLPRELGFVLTAFPIAVATFVVCWTGLSIGIGTVIIWIGVPLLVGTLLLARRFGEFELVRLRAAGRPAIAPPDWALRRRTGGLWRRAVSVLRDGRSWSYWAHAGVVAFVVSCFTWIVGIVWAVIAVAGPTYWFWGRYLSHSGDESWLHVDILRVVPGYAPESTLEGLRGGESVLYGLLGGILLVTLPVVVHGLVMLHELVARLMLGEGSSEALRREISAREVSRVAAIEAEDDALRRLERDIHDGPQQSLLRVQFDLSSAIRALPADEVAARPLLDNALALTKDTLRELRELSRGMAPPLLQDRGLVPALRSLAARNTVPTTATIELPDGGPSLLTLERSVYFVVSELLANVAKHAEASAAGILLALRSTAGETVLVVEVTDDGRGGAREEVGHGLAGVGTRIAGLRGSMEIDSPEGGPTRIAITLPVR